MFLFLSRFHGRYNDVVRKYNVSPRHVLTDAVHTSKTIINTSDLVRFISLFVIMKICTLLVRPVGKGRLLLQGTWFHFYLLRSVFALPWTCISLNVFFFLEMIDKLLFSFTIMIIKIQDKSMKRYFKAINCFKKSYFVNQSSIFFVTILNSTCIGLNSTFSQCNDD